MSKKSQLIQKLWFKLRFSFNRLSKSRLATKKNRTRTWTTKWAPFELTLEESCSRKLFAFVRAGERSKLKQLLRIALQRTVNWIKFFEVPKASAEPRCAGVSISFVRLFLRVLFRALFRVLLRAHLSAPNPWKIKIFNSFRSMLLILEILSNSLAEPRTGSTKSTTNAKFYRRFSKVWNFDWLQLLKSKIDFETGRKRIRVDTTPFGPLLFV